MKSVLEGEPINLFCHGHRLGGWLGLGGCSAPGQGRCSHWLRLHRCCCSQPAITALPAPSSAAHCPFRPLPSVSPAGREGRESFGAKSGLKKKKSGGLSNREKDKRKRLPFAARSGQVGGTAGAGWTRAAAP